MSKSSIADIFEVQRLISKLDKRGKLAILRDLQKQNLFEPDLEKKPQEEEESPNEALIRHSHSCETVI